MSKATEILKTSNQLITDFDVAKIFLWDNRFERQTFKNTTGGELVLKAGTLVGRVSATLFLKELVSGAVDGSEIPVGIVADPEHTLADTDEVDIFIAVAGDVSESQVILDGGDTFDSLVDGRTLRDRIAADTVGIKLVVSDELSGVDNS